MKRLSVLLAITLVFVLAASAQDVPKADLFLGYSFVRANAARDIPAFTANGGLGNIAWNLNDHFALVAEFGGYHNGNINNHELDTTAMTYLFGPRVSYGRSKKVTPYGHILFGGMHFMTSIAADALLVPTPASTTNERYSHSQDAFAMAVGGGLDVKLSRHVTFRPIQLDYLMSRLQDLGLSGTPANDRNQNNLRYAAGIVFNIGAR